MEQGVTAIIMTMLIVFVFIPAIYLGSLNSNKQKVNEAMYLATRSLEDCVMETEYSLEEIAQGYGYSEDPIMRVRIDEGKLFTEFDDILYKNISNPKQFLKTERNIVCRMLVYPDRYVVWEDLSGIEMDRDGNAYYSFDEEFEKYKKHEKDIKISSPKYFTYKQVNFNGEDKNKMLTKKSNGESGYYYINAINDKVRKFGNKSLWREINTYITDFSSNFGYNILDDSQLIATKNLTTYDKNQVIVDTINKEISYYTNGIKMDFINPASTRVQNIKSSKKDFNFFNGITFLVVYKEDNLLNLSGNMFQFNQYTVAGYTLENK